MRQLHLTFLHLLHRPRRGPGIVLVVCALLALLLFPGLLLLRTDNSPEVFFVRDSPGVESYRSFHRTFGSDRLIRLVARGEGLWTPAGLGWLERLERGAAATPGIASVGGLYDHHGRGGEWPPADPEAFRLQALDNPMNHALGWISTDGELVTVTATLHGATPEEDRELLARLRELLATAPDGVDTRLVGLPVLNHALNDSSREIGERFFPLLVLFAVAILFWTVRDPAALVIPLLFVGFCELLVLAPMGYAGVELNMVLAVLPPLLFVIALATALHLLLRFRDLWMRAAHRAVDAPEVCLDTYRDKGWSVFWTGLTTLVGFASLAISPVGPVRSLGVWSGIGLALMTAAAFLFLPALLSLPVVVPPRRSGSEVRIQRLGRRWGRFADRRRRWVLTAFALLSAVALAGVPRIEIESNALRYLAADHPVRAGIEELEAAGIGVAAVEVVISDPTTVAPATAAAAGEDAADGAADSESTGDGPFAGAGAAGRLATLSERIREDPRVLGAVSAGVLLEDAMERSPMPFVGEGVRRQLLWSGLREDPRGRQFLDVFFSPDHRQARLTVFVPTLGTEGLDPLLAHLRTVAGEAFPEAGVEITGEYPLLLEAQRHLLSTLAASLGLTLLAVTIILRLLLPGSRLTILSLLPNLWPVAGMLGIMGWLGVPLDIATVMVASVALGLAVDDTLHTLGHFRKLAPRHGAREGVARTLEITAPAYLLTGIILAAGFGVCALSDFAPVARFGALSATAIVLAVLGDLFLLPALLSLTPSKTVGLWRRP